MRRDGWKRGHRRGFFPREDWETIAETGKFIYNWKKVNLAVSLGLSVGGTMRARRDAPEGEGFAMSSTGLKLAEFVNLFHLEVLNRGNDYDSTRLTITDVNRPGLQFQGFYDYFDPMRLQVIGKAEVMYLKGLSEEARRKCFDDFFLYNIPALVIARELDCFPECMESACLHGRTLLRTKETTVEFTSHTIELLNRVLAPSVTRHGVLLDIHGEGVMITGDSGIGKSEVAIELIKRGNRLVADDAVEIKLTSQNTLMATAPELIRGYMELRGIGVIDVIRLLGMGAIKLNQQIDMVINLEPWNDKAVYDRFGLESHFTDILGVQIPSITIPVKPGRNLASIVEVAAMNNRNRKMGHNAAQELTDRMDKLFQEQLERGMD